jgi:hypothetical protein
MSWNSIARLHGVSARTLYRWRQINHFQEPLQLGTKQIVLPIVENFLRDQPWRGEQSLLAHLRSAPHFLWISLINLRIIINEVDPNGRENRKKKCINRRVYRGFKYGDIFTDINTGASYAIMTKDRGAEELCLLEISELL